MSLANPKRTRVETDQFGNSTVPDDGWEEYVNSMDHGTNDSTEIGEMVPRSALPTRDGTPPTITLPSLTEREYAALKAIMARTAPRGVYELDVRDLILGHPVVDTCPGDDTFTCEVCGQDSSLICHRCA